MNTKVCGKLLTHHRRGYGVDVEALCDCSPSGRAPEKAPRWDLTGTEGCGDGKVVLWLLIRLQRIYNFLLFHAIILPLLDVYGLYYALLYYFWD